ncbi:MAG: hypothetical protein GXO47_03810 [Chlorobi bacterium]|nr:hypothetical protein [Chlorobiota bacterium]
MKIIRVNIRLFKISVIVFLFQLAFVKIGAQDVNYWLSQVGNTSALLGGAAVNGTFDNSGIYYNPGTLAFVENTGISLSGNAFYFNVYNIKNGAGDGLDLKTTGLTGAPSLVSGVIKNKKHPDFSITYAIINTDLYSTLFTVQNNMMYDVISSRPGEEYYLGMYKYQSRIREDWFGFGLGQKFFDSKFGIGISTFVTMRSQDFLEDRSAQVFDQGILPSTPLGTHTEYEDFVFRNIGMIWKLGVNYQIQKFRVGFTITTPKANLSILNGKLIRSDYIDIPSQGQLSYKSTYVNKTRTIHRTPWKFDFGASFIREHHSFYLRVMAATRVKEYSMLKLGSGEEKYMNIPDDPDNPFKSMWMSNRPVVNISMGYGFDVKENVALLGGLRTDFNTYDSDQYPRNETYVANIGNLNLYHISAGTLWYEKKYRLTVGFTYSLGFSRGDRQLINLTSPSDETALFGVNNYSTRTRFNQLGFHFGFTYLFSLIQ